MHPLWKDAGSGMFRPHSVAGVRPIQRALSDLGPHTTPLTEAGHQFVVFRMERSACYVHLALALEILNNHDGAVE